MELASSLAKNATNKAFEIIPLQTTRKENNWKRWREQLQLRRRNGSKGPILDIYVNDDGGNSLPLFSTMASSRYSVLSTVLKL